MLNWMNHLLVNKHFAVIQIFNTEKMFQKVNNLNLKNNLINKN